MSVSAASLPSSRRNALLRDSISRFGLRRRETIVVGVRPTARDAKS